MKKRSHIRIFSAALFLAGTLAAGSHFHIHELDRADSFSELPAVSHHFGECVLLHRFNGELNPPVSERRYTAVFHKYSFTFYNQSPVFSELYHLPLLRGPPLNRA